ncbi:MAG: chromosome segregation protein SMC [Ectothiorhodospiraceae bacterium AqS1]|nr:chromosome segregation protein SMC [Ectothiorhodospiraceae bacterium AqS1]
MDPTTIEFPGAVAGVVGPNGGGKSNIIDAVRWVMGEISARHLRGATMSDVVFNGSNTRKPVSTASVELIFDNSEGRAGSRFADYNEIAVRRQVSRDGQSSYWLNGTRCRRRDVMDIFHGTGLGPRSYAIIEQGMISRLIEAKPDEMRDFLEDAAGISKYKERRRETENRMQHTVENLDRLNDLREEIDRQLAHLAKQATQATKFRELKAEQRKLESEHLALQWQGLDREATLQSRRVEQQQSRVDASLAEQRKAESELERSRAAGDEAAEAGNRCYRELIDAQGSVARSEESIASMRRRKEDLAESLAQEDERFRVIKDRIANERAERESLAAQLAVDEPALEELHAKAAAERTKLEALEKEAQSLQAELDRLAEREREPARSAHAEQAGIAHLESGIEEMRSRQRALEAEREGIDADTPARDVEPLRERIGEMERALAAGEENQSALGQRVRRLREDAESLAKALHDTRATLAQLRARVASLAALQQQALGIGTGAATGWLEEAGFAEAARLAQAIKVDAGWEHAVETVLGARLQAVLAQGVEDLAVAVSKMEQGTFTAIDATRKEKEDAPDSKKPQPLDLPELRSRIHTDWPISDLFFGVHCVDGIDEAMSARAHLGPGQSVITPEGTWIGPAWLHVSRGGEVEGYGVLEREKALLALEEEIARAEAGERDSKQRASDNEEALRAAEEEYSGGQQALNEAHRRYAALRSELATRTAEAEQARAHRLRLAGEIEGLAARIEQAREHLSKARMRFEHSSKEQSRLLAERVQCEERWRVRSADLESLRKAWQGLRDEAYALGLRIEGMRSRRIAAQDAQARDISQLEEIEKRRQTIAVSIEEIEAPLDEALKNLERRLVQRSELEASMRQKRSEVERLEESVRLADEERQRKIAQVEAEREVLERFRIESQESLVLRSSIEKRLADADEAVEALLERMEEEATAQAWAEKIKSVERRIQRLGPINLAAIEERERHAERKRYLDAQHGDLEAALKTLESAIRKMDAETRSRFRETFERVDKGVAAMFPRLFGGGSAGLRLTSENLLEAGVTVMAHPPGKRNASIQLLSGGEKALTAIALVFSIFELNPAPFCMLDEVDAPLDDPNVGRFCALVREMSARVQLIVITHNKITMETAEQLIGVTMHEPGVSRPVAVDIDAAVEMAGA